MKSNIIIILWVMTLTSFTGAEKLNVKQEREDVFLITGYTFNKTNLDYAIKGSQSVIRTRVYEGHTDLIFIENKSSNTKWNGFLEETDIPDKTVEASNTKHQSWRMFRKFTGEFEDFSYNPVRRSGLLECDMTLIFVKRPDRVLIDCTILTPSKDLHSFSGYLLD